MTETPPDVEGDAKPVAEPAVADVPADVAEEATAALEKVREEGLMPATAEHAQPLSYPMAIQLGHAMAQSRFFKDAKEPAQAAVKIIVGAELGFGPAASIMGVDIVEGRPALRGRLLGALVKQHPRFDYKISDWSDKGCTITIIEDGVACDPDVTFDEGDAQTASLSGKDNWKKYGRKMYFWRALSWAVDLHCPQLLGGLPLTAIEDVEAEGAPNLARELSPPTERPPALADKKAEKLRKRCRETYEKLRELNPPLMPPGQFHNQMTAAEHSHEKLTSFAEALDDLVDTEARIKAAIEGLVELGEDVADEALDGTLRMAKRADVRDHLEAALKAEQAKRDAEEPEPKPEAEDAGEKTETEQEGGEDAEK